MDIKSILSSALFACAVVIVVPSHLMAEGACDNLEGAAFGLCDAYCETMDCDEDPVASEVACDKILEAFEDLTRGGNMPCLAGPPICTDTDGGINPDVVGTTTGLRRCNGTGISDRTDRCYTDDGGYLDPCIGADCKLEENFCGRAKDCREARIPGVPGVVLIENVPCKCGCEDGACTSCE